MFFFDYASFSRQLYNKMFQDFFLFVFVLNNIENIEKCTVSFPIYLIYTVLSLPLFLIHFSFSFFCILSHATFLFSFYANHFYLIFLFHSIFSTFLLSFPSCLSLALNIFFKSCSLLTSHAFFTMPIAHPPVYICTYILHIRNLASLFILPFAFIHFCTLLFL